MPERPSIARGEGTTPEGAPIRDPADRDFDNARTHQDVAPEPLGEHLTTSEHFDAAFKEDSRGGD